MMRDLDSMKIEVLDMAVHEPLVEKAIELQTRENPKMLKFSLEGFRAYPLCVIASVNSRGTFVGCNAVIAEYPEDKAFEVGAIYVAPDYRGMKLAWPIKTELHSLMAKRYLGWRALAFTGPATEHLNSKLGFTETQDMSTIPKAALALCQTCDERRTLPVGQVCCTKVLEMQF